MTNPASSSVPGYPDPDTMGDIALLLQRGEIPTNPMNQIPRINQQRRLINKDGLLLGDGGAVALNARATALLGSLQVYLDGAGRARAVGDPRWLVPLPPTVESTQFFVNVAAADDNGDGLTWATAKKKISSAITLGNTAAVPYTVNVAAGVYDRNNSFTGAAGAAVTIPTQPCVIRAIGGVVICHAAGALSWTVESGTTYRATRSNVCRVIDWANRDADGEFVELTQVTTLAACTSTPGTWFQSGDNALVYVNRSDGAVVSDTNTAALLLNVDGIDVSTGGNTHLYGIHQYGGAEGALRCRNAATRRLYAQDCRFAYSTNVGAIDAVQSLDLDLFVGVRCVASHGQKDGFNFHIRNGQIPKAVLVDCVGFENGDQLTTRTKPTSCNGVTIHDGGILIDINGRYFRNYGADTAHVDAGTEAWHIGSQAAGGYGDTNRGGTTPGGVGYLAATNSVVRAVGSPGATLATTGGQIITS